MRNDTNRTFIIVLSAVLIVLMAVVIFLAWAANGDTIDSLRDFVNYLNDHNDTAGRLIVTLGALVVSVLALLLIIVELAPEEEERELRVQRAGATTIVPAAALRQRLEEALVALPEVTAARARVTARDKGISTSLDLTVLDRTNIAAVTDEATRVVVDAIQTDLGLPVAGVPTVRISFGGAKPAPVASSVSRAPLTGTPPAQAEHTREPQLTESETVDERMETGLEAAEAATAGSSPGPIVYEAAPQAEQPDAGPGEEAGPGGTAAGEESVHP